MADAICLSSSFEPRLLCLLAWFRVFSIYRSLGSVREAVQSKHGMSLKDRPAHAGLPACRVTRLTGPSTCLPCSTGSRFVGSGVQQVSVPAPTTLSSRIFPSLLFEIYDSGESTARTKTFNVGMRSRQRVLQGHAAFSILQPEDPVVWSKAFRSGSKASSTGLVRCYADDQRL